MMNVLCVGFPWRKKKNLTDIFRDSVGSSTHFVIDSGMYPICSLCICALACMELISMR